MEKKHFSYKWVILFACFLMVFVCIGISSGTKSLYLAPITQALGISRSMYSLNDSFRHISTAIVNLFFGTLIYKFGVKKMIALGFILQIASILTFAYATNLVMLYIAGCLLGSGFAFTSATMVSAVIRRWCHTNLGKYTSTILAANGIGSAIGAPILNPIINRPDAPFAYRQAYLLTAILMAVIGVIVLLLIRESPKNEPIQSRIDTGKKVKNIGWEGIPFSKAKKQPFFYMACCGIFLTGMMLQGIYGIYAAHMRDVGLDTGLVATMASTLALALTFSKIVVGFLYDRFGIRTVLLACQGFAVICFVLFILIAPSVTGIVMAFAFCITFSLALPLETVVIPLMTNDLFGIASYEKILGIFMAMNYAGFALGAPVINLVFDRTGSYIPATIAMTGFMIVILMVFQFGIKRIQKHNAGSKIKE